MLDHVKKAFVGMLTGASVVTALLMVAVGYSDHIHPESFPEPLLACIGLTFPFFIVANIISLVVLLLVRWKLSIIPIVGFALAYVPIRTYFPINVTSDGSDDCIKIVTYNVCGFGGNYRYEKAVDTVANYLRRIDADIVCLQEVQGGKGGNGFQKMKEIYPYCDSTKLSLSEVLVNALGIFTRYPIIRKEIIDYQSSCNGSVAYYLQVNEDTIIVINNHLEATHLSSDQRKRYKEVLKGEMEQDEAEEEMIMIFEKLADNMRKRAPEAEAVHQYVEAHSAYPIIVCGDFNDTPISYTRHMMAKGLTDCFVSAGNGFGLSYNQKGFNLRIDHMMCSSHFEPYHCFVDDKMDASDHYPLICRLKMGDNH